MNKRILSVLLSLTVAASLTACTTEELSKLGLNEEEQVKVSEILSAASESLSEYLPDASDIQSILSELDLNVDLSGIFDGVSLESLSKDEIKDKIVEALESSGIESDSFTDLNPANLANQITSAIQEEGIDASSIDVSGIVSDLTGGQINNITSGGGIDLSGLDF